MFGFGGGAILQSRFENYDRDWLNQTGRFGIIYGMTNLNSLALQVGYIGAILYILLFFLIMKKCINYYNKEKDSYWKSFGLGMIGFSFIMLFSGLFYNLIFEDDLVPVVYFLLAASIIKLKNKLESKKILAIDSKTSL